ncbi:DUF3592 domain-containing protein [Uliginosibacterium gangwonense]|uniref:DUF3592 domain-containing protein n=1 Tax=Uliginosibacterium gangwonense TaxID=392736 RepID=UPI00036E35EB|nr:DUF3592 domain-containing protein [Uliginosibacterium gangwonense]
MSFIDKIRHALTVPAFILIGIVVIIAGYSERQTSQAIADHGKAVSAQIESIEWKEKGLSKKESGFKATIQFETEDKQQISTTVTVSKDVGQKIRDNDELTELPIKYLPEDPNKVVLADHEDDSGFMFAAGAVLILIGVGIFIYRRKKVQLAQNPA